MKRTVTVTGSGAVSVVPDRARLRLASSCRAATAGEAVAALAEAVAEVHRLARAVADARDVQTAGLQLWPRHDEHGTPTGVEASQQLTVTCPDLSTASRLLAQLSEQTGEGLRVDALELEVSDPAAATVQARELAFADARARAQHLATLGDAALGEVVRVLEGPDVRGARPVAERMALAASVPIEPGQSTVSASVQVTWRLL